MRGSFSLLFYPKGATVDKQGNALLYLRVTVNGQRTEISIQRRINPSKWSSAAGKAIGRGSNEKELNRYMNEIRSKIYKIQEKLIAKGRPFSAQTVKNVYLNKGESNRKLVQLFTEHNGQMEALVGKEYSRGCFLRYERTKSHIANFIKQQSKTDDIFLYEVDLNFITGFEHYLKVLNVGNHNTVTKYVTNLKKIMRIAYANDWISKDPFFNWKAKWKTVEREFLDESEIQSMLQKEISIPRLDQVRDIFLFCCFTGLAYADVKKLTTGHIFIDVNGERWIKTKRTKTDTRSNIPLLPIADNILSKYKNFQETNNNEKLLPVISNQRMNAYLKEIAAICGISKNLTFHLARHTFATTVTLSNGIPIESVSKMLGHKSLKTTQIYARVLDDKVRDDMQVIRNKFSASQNSPSKENNDLLKVVED